MNKISVENQKDGTTEWQLTHPVLFSDRDSAHRSNAIEGYASHTSVNVGEEITFYVSTRDPTFSMKIYRMGWYNEKGGREVYTSDGLPGGIQELPPPLGDDKLIDCDWNESMKLKIPEDWVSGFYLAKLTADDTGKQSYIIFVVREDGRASDFLFQSSVTTFQAYNGWGGFSLYTYNGAQAFRVSFNRPYFAAHMGNIRPYQEATPYATGAGEFFAHFMFIEADGVGNNTMVPAWEYNMVRWLERQGYDVTYCTNIDLHQNPALLLKHKLFLSVGHDEYWSRDMRLNVELGRDQGVHLAFLSGNRVYHQIRLEKDGKGTPDRIVVNYRDNPEKDPLWPKFVDGTASEADLYPYPNWTGEFRRTNYPLDSLAVPWPETLLLATTWIGHTTRDGVALPGTVDEDLIVDEPDHWLFDKATVTKDMRLAGMVGYEQDGFFTNLSSYKRLPEEYPPRNFGIPPTTQVIASSEHGAKTIVYTAESGATVFVSGTIQWSWGLDDFVIPGPAPKEPLPTKGSWGLGNVVSSEPALEKPLRTKRKNEVIEQMTANLLAHAVLSNGATGQFYGSSGQGGFTALGSKMAGWRNHWQIVPGQFTSSAQTSLYFYDPRTGEGFFYEVDGAGQLRYLSAANVGGRKSWRVTAGKFSCDDYTDLLFHDMLTGEAFFQRSLGNGTLMEMGGMPVPFRKTQQIIPGRFSNRGIGMSDLLLYDPARGDATFYKYGCKNAGGIKPLHTQPHIWGRHLEVIAGNFKAGSSLAALLVYNRIEGKGTFYSCDGMGGVQKMKEYEGWPKTLKIIPGRFSDSPLDDILFYEKDTGLGYMYNVDGQGGMRSFGAPFTGWSKPLLLIPGKFDDSGYTSVLAYDRLASVEKR